MLPGSCWMSGKREEPIEGVRIKSWCLSSFKKKAKPVTHLYFTIVYNSRIIIQKSRLNESFVNSLTKSLKNSKITFIH